MAINLRETKLVPGGIQDSMKGNDYQVKTFILYMIKGESTKCPFELTTEIKEAGKFDDVVMDLGSKGIHMVQVKIKVSPVDFNFGNFLNKPSQGKGVKNSGHKIDIKNFELIKYITSHAATINNFNLQNISRANLVTNMKMKTPNATTGMVEFEENGNSIYFKKIADGDPVFENYEHRYTLLTNSSNFDSRTKGTIKEYLPNHANITDDDLEKFMKHFVLITDYKTEHLDNEISAYISQQFNLSNIESLKHCLEGEITKWIKNMEQGNHIMNNDKVEKLFKKIQKKCEVVQGIIGRNETILRKELILFKSNEIESKLIKFIESDVEKRILYIETEKEESDFVLQKLVKYLNEKKMHKDSYLIINKGTLNETSVSAFEEVQGCLGTCIIECHAAMEKFIIERLETKSENDETKKLLIIYEKNSNLITPDQTKGECIIQPKVTLNDLTENCLQEILERKEIHFQGREMFLIDLIDNEELKNKISLQEILKEGKLTIGKDEKVPLNLYIERTICGRIEINEKKLNADISNNKFKYSIVNTKSAFEVFCENKPDEIVHWLEITDQQKLQWRQSQKSVSNLTQYLEEKPCDFTEERFLSIASKTNVIVDSAGMGKTWLVHSLARTLKDSYKNHWIVTVDLNSFTRLFNENKNISGLNFIRDHVLKLEGEIEKILFDYACQSSGQVTIFFDGFDEIARNYKEIVLAVIEYWMKNTKVNCFIATRPEWKELLEDKFTTISFYLEAFTEQDKKNFLKQKWKDLFNFSENKLNEIIGTVLENFSTKITQKQIDIPGTPLIMKLLSEYFEDKIMKLKTNCQNASELISQLKSENYGLFVLYDDFVGKIIARHMVEKQGTDLSKHWNIEQLEETQTHLNELHRRFAVRHIFNEEILKKLPGHLRKPLKVKEENKLVNCGIITRTNDKLSFLHFTFIEYFVADFFIENLDDKNVVAILLKEVLSKEFEFKVIKMFLNHSFKSLKEQPEEQIARNIYENLVEEEELVVALHFACFRENNVNTFEFLFNSIMEISDSEEERNNLKKILKFEWYGDHMIYLYFEACEASMEIVEKIKSVFGLNYVKEILLTGEGYNINVFLASTEGGNFIKLLEWILKHFPTDKEFLKTILLSEDKGGNGILQYAIDNYSSGFLEILKRIETIIGERMFPEMIMHKTESGKTILHSVGSSTEFSEILDFIKSEIDEINYSKILKDLLFSVATSQKFSILYYLFRYCSDENMFKQFTAICEFIKRELDIEMLKKFLLIKNASGQLFFEPITTYEGARINAKLETFNWIKTEAGSDVMKEIYNSSKDALKNIYRNLSSQQKQQNSIIELKAWIQQELDDAFDV